MLFNINVTRHNEMLMRTCTMIMHHLQHIVIIFQCTQKEVYSNGVFILYNFTANISLHHTWTNTLEMRRVFIYKINRI